MLYALIILGLIYIIGFGLTLWLTDVLRQFSRPYVSFLDVACDFYISIFWPIVLLFLLIKRWCEDGW